MSNRSVLFVRLCLCTIVLGALAPAAVGAGLTSSSTTPDPITQTASMPLTPTNFASGGSIGNPLTFQQFNTQNGSLVLDSVTLTMNAAITNNFAMNFTTPATITTSLASSDGTQPGPSITVYQPDGKTPLVTASVANDATALSRSITWGNVAGQALPQTFSSSLPSTSPYYIAPGVSSASQTLTLTSASDLALFSGTGSLSLPVAGSAWAKITSSSGNGYGSVTTQGTADVTVSYTYHDAVPAPQTVPEPAAVVLWSLGSLGLALRYRLRSRRRAA